MAHLETAQGLVDEGLEVGIAERLTRADLGECQDAGWQSGRMRAHDSVQVCFHKLFVEVDLLEVLGVDEIHIVCERSARRGKSCGPAHKGR